MAAPRIHFLGTGNAFNTDGRASQAILLEPPSASPLLVDMGPTITQAVARHGVDCASLDRLFVTHHHGDHTAGWPFLLLHLVILQRRTRPLDVYGPEGTRECLEALAALCWGDVLRLQQFEVRYHEIPVEEASGLDGGQGMTFDVYPMEHHPSSIAYRFDLDGHRVAVSGDTSWCPNLEKLAAGSDSLIVECSSTERQDVPHISLDELREGVGRLGTGRVYLVHLTDDVAHELSRHPIPRVEATYDGMSLTPRD